MRWIAAILALVFVTLQGHLWLSDSAYRKTHAIRQALLDVRSENAELAERNRALAAEVDNLKTSFEATEERARSDLGMIGADETFFQIVPSAD